MEKPLNLVSWNVNGIRAAIKKGFFEWLEQTSPDILSLQETKISADQLTPEMTERAGYHSFWSHAEKRGYSGVALYTKERPLSVTEDIGDPRFNGEGRVLRADYSDFIFFGIYFPNGQRSAERLAYKMDFYEAFLAHCRELHASGKRLIVCGDYNTAHREIDLARPKENSNTSGFLPEEREWIDRYIDAGFVDTFRLFCQDSGEYSWWNMRTRARERNVGWRIDYFFVSEALKAQVRGAKIHQDIMGSDHCPVSMTLSSS